MYGYFHTVPKERIRYMSEQMISNQTGLYRPQFEHDNCGIGAVINIKGRKSHSTVELESYCRFRISFSPEFVSLSASF